MAVGKRLFLTRGAAGFGAALALALGGCASRTVPATSRPAVLAPLPLAALGADSARSDTIARGVVVHRLWIPAGPWAVQIMEVDRRSCWMPVASKGGETAAGRMTTTEIVGKTAPIRGHPGVAGGVNGDFFLFNPPGVPVGAHIERGNIYTGPTRGRPSFIVDDTGGIAIADLEPGGKVWVGERDDFIRFDSWNHPGARGGVAIFDERYGASLDTTGRRLSVSARVTGRTGRSIAAILVSRDSGNSLRGAPPTGTIVLTELLPDSARGQFARLPLGTAMTVQAALQADLRPVPREAISGHPRLLRNGALAARIDSAGNEGFRGRHPRTAVGYDYPKRRLLLVTVDGRQEDWSAGMTLRELADLFLKLGASDALNLDGGGSTAMVVRSAHGLVLANRPSDKEGERAVANALVIVRRPGCDS